MTTYTIKPIEWREGDAYIGKQRIANMFKAHRKDVKGCYIALFLLTHGEKFCNSKNEAKSFIETSYREFVEQFLEKQ